MSAFDFLIEISGVDPTEPNFEDRFYDAGCDDALICSGSGKVALDFTREAENLAQAVASAITDIQKAGAKPLQITFES